MSDRKKRLVLIVTCSVALITLAGALRSGLRRGVTANGVAKIPLREELTDFHYRQTSPGFRLVVTGEAASLDRQQGADVSAPTARIETETGRVITMETAEDGTAELIFSQEDGVIRQITLRKGVVITRREESTGRVEFTALSEEAVYDHGRQELVLTGNPVVYQGKNEFRGEIIYYRLAEETIFIERKVSGVIYDEPEE